MDDILIFENNQNEHDIRLTVVLEIIQAVGVTLNKEKRELNKPSLTFLGDTIDEKGTPQDPQKTTAIGKMALLKSSPELRCFMGMVNQLGKFSPHSHC